MHSKREPEAGECIIAVRPDYSFALVLTVLNSNLSNLSAASSPRNYGRDRSFEATVILRLPNVANGSQSGFLDCRFKSRPSLGRFFSLPFTARSGSLRKVAAQ